MAQPTRDDLFKPNLTRTETKAEAVSRVAKSLIDQEIVKRDAKTARLREARLAQEAAAVPVIAVKAPRAARSRVAK